MDINDLIAKSGGLRAIARELGVSEDDASRGTAALAPAVLGGFERHVTPANGTGLSGLLNRLGGSELLDNVLSNEATDVSRGNGVLASIFGSKDVSRAVARDASITTGLDQSLLKKMLPIVAMMVAGHMAKKGGGGMLGGILQRMR